MQDHYTLIFVRDNLSPVRRFQVQRRKLRIAAGIAGAAALLVLGVSADWVALRLDAIDVEKMRVETAAQRDEVERLAGDLEKLEAEISRLEEFERKVRIIANLPSTLARNRVNEPAVGGQGGPDDEGDPPADSPSQQESTKAPANLSVVGRGDDSNSAQRSPASGAEGAARSEPKASEVHQDVSADHRPADHRPADHRPADHALGEDTPEPSTQLLYRLQHLRTYADVLLDSARARHASYAALLDGLETRTAQLAATPSIWPASGWVTSGYGHRTSPFTGQRHFHSGIDIAADFGTPVVAPAAARVRYAGRKGALGRSVVLEHGSGIRTTYGHLAESFVKRGERVERGQRIGAVGSTGRSTGPHLHYSIAVNGKSVNPMDYVLE